MQDQPHSLVLVFWIQWQDNVKTTGDRLGCRSCQKMKHMVPSNHLRGCTPDWYKVYFIACPPLQRWLQGSGFSRWLPLTLQSQCPLTDLPLIFVKVSSYPLHQYPGEHCWGWWFSCRQFIPEADSTGFQDTCSWLEGLTWPDLQNEWEFDMFMCTSWLRTGSVRMYRISEELVCTFVYSESGVKMYMCTIWLQSEFLYVYGMTKKRICIGVWNNWRIDLYMCTKWLRSWSVYVKSGSLHLYLMTDGSICACA